MLHYIWNIFFDDNRKTQKAHNLLLTKCLQRRYKKQKKSILIIQRYAIEYLERLEQEEMVYLKNLRNTIKMRERLFM